MYACIFQFFLNFIFLDPITKGQFLQLTMALVERIELKKRVLVATDIFLFLTLSLAVFVTYSAHAYHAH